MTNPVGGGSLEETRLLCERLLAAHNVGFKLQEKSLTDSDFDEKTEEAWAVVRPKLPPSGAELSRRQLLTSRSVGARKPSQHKRGATRRGTKRSARGKQAVQTDRSLASERSVYAFHSEPVPRAPRVLRTILKLTAAAVSTAGGLWATVTGNDPSVATGWSSWASAYELFRVRRVRILFQPTTKYDSVAGFTTNAIVYSNDFNSNTALGSYTAGTEYEQFTLANTADQFEHEIVTPNAAPYSNWIATGSPAATCWMKPYASGLGVTQSFGYLLSVYEVEFSGQD